MLDFIAYFYCWDNNECRRIKNLVEFKDLERIKMKFDVFNIFHQNFKQECASELTYVKRFSYERQVAWNKTNALNITLNETTQQIYKYTSCVSNGFKYIYSCFQKAYWHASVLYDIKRNSN